MWPALGAYIDLLCAELPNPNFDLLPYSFSKLMIACCHSADPLITQCQSDYLQLKMESIVGNEYVTEFVNKKRFQSSVWSILQSIDRDHVSSFSCEICGDFCSAPIIAADGTAIAFRAEMCTWWRTRPTPTGAKRKGSLFQDRILIGNSKLRNRVRILSKDSRLKARQLSPEVSLLFVCHFLDDFLKLSGRQLLTHAGKISHDNAVARALAEYEKFRQSHLNEPSPVEKHFTEAIKEVKVIEKAVKKGKKKAGTRHETEI